MLTSPGNLYTKALFISSQCKCYTVLSRRPKAFPGNPGEYWGARCMVWKEPSITNKAAVWLDLGLGGCLSWAAALPGVLGAVGSHGSPLPQGHPPHPGACTCTYPRALGTAARTCVCPTACWTEREHPFLPSHPPSPSWALVPCPGSEAPTSVPLAFLSMGLGCFCEDSGKEVGRKSRAQPDQTTAQHGAGLPWAWPLLPGGS